MNEIEIIKQYHSRLGKKSFEARKKKLEELKGRKITGSEMMKEVRKHRVDKALDKGFEV